MIKTNTLLKVLISGIIVVALLYFTGIENIMETILILDPHLLLLAVSITIPTTFFKILRWKLILKASNVNIPFAEIIRIFMIGFFFGAITPSRVGNLIKFHYLRKYHNVPTSTAISISMIDRIFDVIVLAAFALLGLILVTTAIRTIYTAIAFVIIILAIILFIFNEKTFKKIATFGILRIKALRKLVKSRGEIDTNKAASDLYIPVKRMKNPKIFSITMLLTILIWTTIGVQIFLILLAMGVPVNVYKTIVFSGTSSFLGLVPITISGLGVREGSLAFFLSTIGVSLDSGVAASLILYLIGHIPPALVGMGLYFVYKRRKVFLRSKQTNGPSDPEQTGKGL
ncbi:MAG: flippase-like domain-containing protein [Nanoarchaeota archaeon]|nr:flippase-like domain-containing protein [Nanoarchaeota archaeon]